MAPTMKMDCSRIQKPAEPPGNDELIPNGLKPLPSLKETARRMLQMQHLSELFLPLEGVMTCKRTIRGLYRLGKVWPDGGGEVEGQALTFSRPLIGCVYMTGPLTAGFSRRRQEGPKDDDDSQQSRNTWSRDLCDKPAGFWILSSTYSLLTLCRRLPHSKSL